MRFDRRNVPRTWLWHEDRPRERREVVEEEEPDEQLVDWPEWLIALLRREGL